MSDHLLSSSDIELIERFASLRVGRSRSQKAPHKPLLLLLALARAWRREPRLIAYDEIEPELTRLLDEFGQPLPQQQPELPFWYLSNDNAIWDIDSRDELIAARGERRKKHIPPKILREHRATAGFTIDVYERLCARPGLIPVIASVLLHDHFPASRHDDICSAVGISPGYPIIRGTSRDARTRDPGFRRMILDIYENRCAVCGYGGRLGAGVLAIEAAHIQWHSHDGPDSPDNGLALCTFHHKILDCGAIGIDDDHRILVSPEVGGGDQADHLILRFADQPLRQPRDGAPRPALAYVRWHRERVFRL